MTYKFQVANNSHHPKPTMMWSDHHFIGTIANPSDQKIYEIAQMEKFNKKDFIFYALDHQTDYDKFRTMWCKGIIIGYIEIGHIHKTSRMDFVPNIGIYSELMNGDKILQWVPNTGGKLHATTDDRTGLYLFVPPSFELMVTINFEIK